MLSIILAKLPMILEKALTVVGLASTFVWGVAKAFPNFTPAGKVGRFLDKVLAFAGRVALNPKQPAPPAE